jgi:hypothetical protein
LRDAIRLTYALIDQWIASYKASPAGVTLDIDDTCDGGSRPSATLAVRRPL